MKNCPSCDCINFDVISSEEAFQTPSGRNVFKLFSIVLKKHVCSNCGFECFTKGATKKLDRKIQKIRRNNAAKKNPKGISK